MAKSTMDRNAAQKGKTLEKGKSIGKAKAGETIKGTGRAKAGETAKSTGKGKGAQTAKSAGRGKPAQTTKVSDSENALPSASDMDTAWENAKIADFYDPAFYTNRELSWLDFNYRILDEARDKTNPTLSRIRMF